MKKRQSLRTIKERLLLAIASNCRAGGQRAANMSALAQSLGFSGEGSVEDFLMRHVRRCVPASKSRVLLNWAISQEIREQRVAPPAFHQSALV